MHSPSPALAATLHALHGEPDVHIVAPALGDLWFAPILALAPNVDPIIGALGALAGERPDLLAPDIRTSPALSAAVASLIGTNASNGILPTWAKVAPTGWGVAHATALFDAVQRNRCPRRAAAALIGPCDASAALLSQTWDIAHTVPCWGQATPDTPTAWMDALTPTERDRLLDALRLVPESAVACLPWLPEADAADIVHRIGREYLSLALAAYAAASPVAHARHAAVLSALIHRARQDDLIALTRLAAASHMEGAWDAVVQILHEHPDAARDVVAAAPWNNVRADVQETILSAAQQNDECAAIAFARGMHDQPLRITRDLAGAFFASVTPTVWHALPTEMQQMWIRRLAVRDAHLAVRSLGLDPAFLACADLDADVIAAVRRHAPNETSLRRTLLPIAVRRLPPDAVPAVVAALPNPPDPVAFVQIAGGMREMPPALHDWIVTNPTPQAHGAAVTVLHAAAQRVVSVKHRRELAHALAGWSWEETNALFAALPDKFVTALHPHPDILTRRLACPQRQNSFRQALDALTALPPSAALPALQALDALAAAQYSDDQRDAGEEAARVLRDHGGIFAMIVGMLYDDVRAAVLPSSDDPQVGSAINDLAIINPLVAHYLAYALRDADAAVALAALTESAPDTLTRIWDLLPETLQQSVLGDRDALLHDVAGPDGADMLAQTLRDRNADDRRSWLALRMLRDADAERRMRGAAILAQRPDVAAALLPLLNDDLRTALESVPAIAFANADLPSPYPTAPASIRRRRR
jgi:hypothetical protein